MMCDHHVLEHKCDDIRETMCVRVRCDGVIGGCRDDEVRLVGLVRYR